ncbi:CoA pyrophosphatase [Bacteroidales bacterium]
MPTNNDLHYLVKKRLGEPLPGWAAQSKLEPITRRQTLQSQAVDRPIPRESAVMILLHFLGSEPSLLFIQRAVYDGVHSGQVAFPGGGYELADNSLLMTAQRETLEETGIVVPDQAVIGKLTPLYIPPSNFNVHPFVGFLPELPPLKPDPKEVGLIFTVPLNDLMQQGYIQQKTITAGDGLVYEIPCYVIGSHIIWGATSMILSEFLEVIRWATESV